MKVGFNFADISVIYNYCFWWCYSILISRSKTNFDFQQFLQGFFVKVLG